METLPKTFALCFPSGSTADEPADTHSAVSSELMACPLWRAGPWGQLGQVTDLEKFSFNTVFVSLMCAFKVSGKTLMFSTNRRHGRKNV